MIDKTTKKIYVYTKIPCYNSFHVKTKVEKTKKVEFSYPLDLQTDFLFKLFSFS
jgi:hypothetical protein